MEVHLQWVAEVIFPSSRHKTQTILQKERVFITTVVESSCICLTQKATVSLHDQDSRITNCDFLISLKVEFEGNGGHAGAVLMPNRQLLCLNIEPFRALCSSYLIPCEVKITIMNSNGLFIISVNNVWNRNDAGLAAAELALAVEKHVLESGSIDTVGTVGE